MTNNNLSKTDIQKGKQSLVDFCNQFGNWDDCTKLVLEEAFKIIFEGKFEKNEVLSLSGKKGQKGDQSSNDVSGEGISSNKNK